MMDRAPRPPHDTSRVSGEGARELLTALTPVEAAPRLLGSWLRVVSAAGAVTLRIVEVEAYWGQHDPGSHGSRGQTPRNAVMFGPAGHLYVYFTYGMHVCGNIVTGPAGDCAAVLLRGAEVVEGAALARDRRERVRARRRVRAANPKPITDAELARGPANLMACLGVQLDHNGVDLVGRSDSFSLSVLAESEWRAFEPNIRAGLRTGVAVPGGLEPYRWRWWLDGSAAVSAYTPHKTVRAVSRDTALSPSRSGERPESW